MRHPRPWDSISRFFLTFKYPVVVATAGVFCFTWYWWVLSIVTFIPAAYAQYSPAIQGLLFLGLLLGSWFAELFCSGRMSDWIVQKLNRKHEGSQIAERRLWLAYPAAVLSASKCLAHTNAILLLLTVDDSWPCHLGPKYRQEVALGRRTNCFLPLLVPEDRVILNFVANALSIVAMGIQMGNTMIPTYIVDCYPLQSMSAITFYSVLLDLSAFINPVSEKMLLFEII